MMGMITAMVMVMLSMVAMVAMHTYAVQYR